MKEFRGKTAVITGAAHGFGAEFARECARRGMKLVLNDFEAGPLQKLADELAAQGAEVAVLPGTVSEYETVQALMKTATDKFSTLDLLFNNAGVYYIGAVWDMPARDVQWMLDVNTLSIFYGVREAVPVMRAQGTPCHIVNVASVAGLITTRTMAAYHASKHAVVAASEAILFDLQSLEGNQIGLSVFCPGYIQTDLHHSERRRPARYADPGDPYYQSETYKKNIALVDKFITTGEPIEVVVPTVFGGIEEDRFYITTDATAQAFLPMEKKRHANIENGQNPDIKNIV